MNLWSKEARFYKSTVFNNMKGGFTLIEVIIYIALLTFIIGSGVAASFYLINSTEEGKSDINAIAEAEFLMRKIDWALIDVNNIILPSGGPSTSLSLVKMSDLSTTIVIDTDTSVNRARIFFNATPEFLTGDRVKIENLLFTEIPATPPKPGGITATFTANGQSFSMTKYLRK